MDLDALLAALDSMGVGSVMVEGGAALITSFLRAGWWIASRSASRRRSSAAASRPWATSASRDLAESFVLTDTAVTPYGVDLVLDSRVEYPNGSR